MSLFDRLDAEIARTERLLTVARECGFADVAAMIERDIVEQLLPGYVAMCAMTDGAVRAQIADRHRRLSNLLT